jgi:DNA-binding CsgD family transcriptional regulator
LLVEHATTRMKQREGAVAASLARRGLDLLEALHLPVSTAKRIQAVGMMITDAPRATWEPLLHEARADAQREGDVAAELAAGNMMVSADEASGDPLAARRLAAELVETARAHGLVDMELSIRTTVLSNFNSQGEYERVVTDGFELLGEPMARRLRAETAGYTALALVDLGRLDDAKALIDDELARAEDAAIGHYDLTWAAAELAFASGDLARTESIADECLRLMGDADYQDVFFMRVLRMWARTLSGRDPGEPLAYSRELESLWLGLVPESAAIRLLHDAAGEASLLAVEAAGRFEEAADLFAPYHRRSELRCRWASGEALRRAGRTADARVVLEACEARAEELGMVPLTNRIRRSLRLAGVRRSAPRARSGRLSARESEVLALVADGLTNAEIALRLGIGRPTVVRIVANASAKLGATTRAQAAVQALEVG